MKPLYNQLFFLNLSFQNVFPRTGPKKFKKFWWISGKFLFTSKLKTSFENEIKNWLKSIEYKSTTRWRFYFFVSILSLTDTGEDSKLVHRWKRAKVDTLFSTFFPPRPSDEYESAPSRKYSLLLLDVFACIG